MLRNRLLLFLTLCTWWTAPIATQACFYSLYAFDTQHDSQTNLEDLLLDRYVEEEKSKARANFYSQELKRRERDLSGKRQDPEFLRDYGYLLHVTGNTPTAIRIWEEALAKAPNDYALLCNLATAHQILGVDHYAKARELLQKAVRLKPGFRHKAEEFHLRLIEHLMAQSEDWQYIRRELLFPQLTPAWRARKEPPNEFNASGLPKDAIQGLAELLRQFPKQGDTWMVLGMLLETRGKWREARLAYQKALKFGCGMTEELREYFEKYRAFAEKKNPVRYVGWLFLSAFFLMIAAFIGPRMIATVRAVVEDIQNVRRQKVDREDKTSRPQPNSLSGRKGGER
ncbi:MAG: tetratricopeptide repeat protein [Candidatus Sumerlaeaceae bacterium]